MGERDRIFRNFIFLLIGGIIASLVEFAIEIMLARRLSDTGYGHWSYAQSVFIYLILIVDIGLAVYGAREIARCREQINRFIANIVVVRTLVAVILSAVLFIYVLRLGIPAHLKTLYMGGFSILLALAFNPEFVFQGIERMVGIALWRILNYVFFFILVLLIVHRPDDLQRVSWLRGISYIGAVLILWLIIAKITGLPRFGDIAVNSWLPMLKVSVFIAASTLIVNVYFTFDTLVIGKFLGAQQVGWYSAAYKVVGQFLGLAIMVQVVFGPVISRWRDNASKLDWLTSALQVVMLYLGGLIAGGLYFISDVLIIRLYGQEFLQSVFIFKVLLIVIFLFFYQTIYTTLLLYSGKERLYLWSMSAGGMVNLVLNLIIVPIWGMIGALAATLFSHLVIAGIAFLFYRYRVQKELHHIHVLGISMKMILFFVMLVIVSFINNAYFACILFCAGFTILYILMNLKKISTVFNGLVTNGERLI